VRATAATAQIAINGAISPILTIRGITRIICYFFAAHPRYRKQREGARTGQNHTDASNKTAPGCEPCSRSGRLFKEIVKPVHGHSTSIFSAALLLFKKFLDGGNAALARLKETLNMLTCVGEAVGNHVACFIHQRGIGKFADTDAQP